MHIQLLRTHLQEDAVLAGRTSDSDNARIDELLYDNDKGKTLLRVELDKPLNGQVGSFRRDNSARRRTFFLYDTERTDARLVMPPSLNQARIELARFEQAGLRGETYALAGSKWEIYADKNLNSIIFKQGIEHFARLRRESQVR